MTEPTTRRASELIALNERQLWLRGLRLVGFAIICVVLATDPAGLARTTTSVWPAVAGYGASIAVLELLWWVRGRWHVGPRELWLLTWMLLLDAGAVVWTTDASGGLVSPLRYLAYVQVVAVVLLSSYRTGVKLAVWYCLLFLTEYVRAPSQLDGRPGHLMRPLGVREATLTTYLVVLVLLTLVAAGASAISERELRRRRRDLESLADLATAMEHAATPADVGQILVERLAADFGLTRLVLVGTGAEPALLGRGAGARRDVTPVPLGPRSVVTTTADARTTRLLRALDATADPWLTGLLPDARNLVTVPLTAEGGCLGVLVFEYDRRAGSRLERRMLTIVERFAAHTALAMRNALLLERVRRVAAVDGLTAIPNRRTFEEELERETVRAGRTGEPVSLIMIDIDHFKLLNDTHGHQVGDDVLQQVAQVLRAASRDYDVVARYGGEEFAVIVPACGRDEARQSADRLLTALREASTTVPVTASLGCATFPDDASSSRRLVDRADQALYAAKRGGRDRVEVFQQPLAEQIVAQAGEPVSTQRV